MDKTNRIQERVTHSDSVDTAVYAIENIIDYRQPEIKEHIEKAARRNLLEHIQERLFMPGKHVIEITRTEETAYTSIPGSFGKVKYKVSIQEVPKIQLEIPMKPYYQAKGRNHRKKDRAAARRRRAQRKNLEKRLRQYE